MQITLGRPNNGLSLGGSTSNTSNAAPATWPAFNALGKRALVDEAAARAVDDAHTLLGLLQRAGTDDVARLVGQRRVQRDEVGAPQQGVELDLLHAQLHRPLRRQERVVGDHLHLEADGAVGDDGADIAAADHAQRLGVELHAQELRLFPLAALRGAVGLRDLPGQRHHQRDGVLCGGDRIAEGRVHDDDALGGRGLDVDVVDADAGAADHPELAGGRDHLLRHLGGGAHGEAVVILDDLLQLLFSQADLHVSGEAALLEDADRGGRKLIGDENAWAHGLLAPRWRMSAVHASKSIRIQPFLRVRIAAGMAQCCTRNGDLPPVIPTGARS